MANCSVTSGSKSLRRASGKLANTAAIRVWPLCKLSSSTGVWANSGEKCNDG